MQIDWITVSAQIVNFLILVWLLKRFLYQPVLDAMDRREERITERLNDAEEKTQKADEEKEHYQEERRALEKEREQIFSEAEEAADEEKKEMLEAAREEVAETRRAWQRQAEEEKSEFLTKLRRQTAEGVEAIARKTLKDLASTTLEERVVETFVERLEELDTETRTVIARASDDVRIATAFELPSSVRGRLTRAVHEHLDEDLDVHYEQSEDFACGIELRSGERRLGWNVDAYLDEVASRVEETFDRIQPEEGS